MGKSLIWVYLFFSKYNFTNAEKCCRIIENIGFGGEYEL
jgi:hypothetical protein